MKRAASSLIFVLLLAAGLTPAIADEGMWQTHQLPELGGDLKSLGLKIDPGKLTDLTDYPMNAVISLGGCTASFVSPEGLVVTNHHCAYGTIQYNSTADNNLLQNGFLAAERGDELPARPGTRVMVTVAVEEVTEKIRGKLSEKLTGAERYQAIEDRQKKLVASCEKDEGHRCRVASFYGGLQYYLVKRLEIRDVRLVYAPAAGIGNYGGDIDNWMWPRHTGDYSFYRAYVGKDGKPADRSEENVPYRPKHHLKVSSEGLRDGDFVMVVGYPAGTNRYRLASEVENSFSWYYPTRGKLLREWLEIINEQTAERPDAAIKYAGTVASINNTTKNYEGLLDGFSKSGMLEGKRRQEAGLRGWLAERGAGAMDELEKLIAERNGKRERRLYYSSMMRRAALLNAARRLYRLSEEKGKPDAEREPGFQERDLRRIEERLTRIDRSFDPAVDRASWRQFIVNYASIPPSQHVAPFDEWFGITGNIVNEDKLDSVLEKMYAGTELGDLENRLAWMEAKPEEFKSSKDPFIKLAVRLYEGDMQREEEDEEAGGRFNLLRSRYMNDLIAYRESLGRPLYPDANGTLRVTYGTVQGYSPRDAVFYTPFTTVRGVVEKDTGERPFDAPPALLQAIGEKRFGKYADDKLGSVVIDFLSNVDTTGGNSGSPTLNGKGELVGLLFDGVFESIIADWAFEPESSRSIHADIRYVLWIMEQVDHADHLLREMGLRRD
jgi:hypothetical protein